MTTRTPILLTLCALLIGVGCDNSVQNDGPDTGTPATDATDAPEVPTSGSESSDSTPDNSEAPDGTDIDGTSTTGSNEPARANSSGPDTAGSSDPDVVDEIPLTGSLETGTYDFVATVESSNCGPDLEDSTGTASIRIDDGIFGELNSGGVFLSVPLEAIEADGQFLMDTMSTPTGDGDCIVTLETSGSGAITDDGFTADMYLEYSDITRECGEVARYADDGVCTATVTYTFTPAEVVEAPAEDTVEEAPVVLPSIMPISGIYDAALEVGRSGCGEMTPDDGTEEMSIRAGDSFFAITSAELIDGLVIERIEVDGRFEVPAFEIEGEDGGCEFAVTWSGEGTIDATDAFTMELDAVAEQVGGDCRALSVELPCAMHASVDFTLTR